jgi:hypothetical protein
VLSLSFSDIQGQMILEGAQTCLVFIGSLNGPIFFFMQKELNPKQMLVIKIRDNDNRTFYQGYVSCYQINSKVKMRHLSANKHCTGG